LFRVVPAYVEPDEWTKIVSPAEAFVTAWAGVASGSCERPRDEESVPELLTYQTRPDRLTVTVAAFVMPLPSVSVYVNESDGPAKLTFGV